MEHSAKQNTTTITPKRKESFFGGKSERSFFSLVFIQSKLTIGPVDDPYEREADAVADKVMRMSNEETLQTKLSPVTVQRKCATCEEEEKLQKKEDDKEDNPIQLNPTKEFDVHRKCSHCEEDEKLQMKSKANVQGRMTAPSIVNNVINSSGQPLDAGTRNFMESRFGYDFGNVQIHNDSLANQSSADINALAYSYGNHVVFGAEQYRPNTNGGKQLTAHELAHVVQQKSITGLSGSQYWCYHQHDS